ncbi:leucine-rich repeat protein 1-like [Miscanthus floridulus]|uniref:leucine-rich repeat protein 1-like n=1 Tax=Miscanthus floridulus TaxID=154761 RepID=UPI0034598FDF
MGSHAVYIWSSRATDQGAALPRQEFGKLKNLISMDLYNNDLSGPLPTTLGNLKSQKVLRIDHNRLTGPIPRELSGLPNLGTVDFSSNDLWGTIPTTGPFQNIPLTSFSNNPWLSMFGWPVRIVAGS